MVNLEIVSIPKKILKCAREIAIDSFTNGNLVIFRSYPGHSFFYVIYVERSNLELKKVKKKKKSCWSNYDVYENIDQFY